MNQIMISVLVILTALFHLAVRSHVKSGQIREAFCAGWCIDAAFAICGTIISFALFHYAFVPFLTLRNLLWGLLFFVVTFSFCLLAPSGLSLFRNRKKDCSEEEILLAEYRFHDTLCMVKNFFQALLFGIPLLLTCLENSPLQLSLFLTWSSSDICGAVCFTAFLVLLPISLRQSFFWLIHLTGQPTQESERILQQYRIRLHYRRKNRRL